MSDLRNNQPKVRWANFLHIYQPTNQAFDVLEAIVNQSYRRLFQGFKKVSHMKLTLNISGALSELFLNNGYEDVISDIRELAENGRLEFTETAKHHPFLPFLPDSEIERQVALNHETNKKIFGSIYRPTVFFPPEMAYDEHVGKVVNRLGYQTILLDEIASTGKVEATSYEAVVKIAGAEPLVAVFRNRRASNLMISAVARHPETFLEALGDDVKKEQYLLTAMDGETFGHHRPGLEEMLFSLLSSSPLKQVFVSEIAKHFPPKESRVLRACTWASSEYDLENGIQFHSWRDEKNEIHRKQWQLYELVLQETIQNKEETEFKEARKKLDVALASDQFFWASNRPWWSLEMIEQGAWLLLDTVNVLSSRHEANQKKARELYREIIDLAFHWQRYGKIRKEAHEIRERVKIPFKERTVEAGKPEVFRAFVEFMKWEMKKAAEKEDFEEAILWRDAVWKLETKNDIYDAVHVVDILRNKVPTGELKDLADFYREEYRKLRGGQAEDRM